MTILTLYLLIFLLVSAFFIFFHLMLGKIVRPDRSPPESDKMTIYECGEPTIGSSWIQFDLRFYVVALLFVIFDVEVVFFFPWAVVFGKANSLAKDGLSDEKRMQLTREVVTTEQLKYFEAQIDERIRLSQRELTPDEHQKALERAIEKEVPIQPGGARDLAWLAFWDILVFFGVLLVGFAYLWKRGDLDWVRSTAAEDSLIAANGQDAVLVSAEAEELAGAAPGH
jgi:NADH-quinone oxidoreductase subunit A